MAPEEQLSLSLSGLIVQPSGWSLLNKRRLSRLQLAAIRREDKFSPKADVANRAAGNYAT